LSIIDAHVDEVWNQTLLENVLKRANDAPSFALHVSLDSLLDPGSVNYDKVCQALLVCLKMLQKEWFNQTQNEWLLSCCSLQGLTYSCSSVTSLLLLLIEAGAPIQSKDAFGRNRIASFLHYATWSLYDRSTIIDILGILIEKGVNVNETFRNKLTPSMYARLEDRWDEWCAALERQNRKIDDVLRVEGNEWLLEDGWKRVWKDCKLHNWRYVY
jgi:hypothetical protein